MNNEKNNGRGIFYGVIGVATLVVAIIGATFAYFTATQNNNTAITGNAASVSFALKVERAETTDQTNGGLIPMSNSMIEKAVNTGGTIKTGQDSQGNPTYSADNKACVDSAHNSVCQIYKITLTNTASASMFLDGYITLNGGYGTSTDVDGLSTTMRWAQVFYTESPETGKTNYSTGGTTNLNASSELTIADIDNPGEGTKEFDGKNLANILTDGTAEGTKKKTDIMGTATISGSTVPAIKANYIRTSKHTTGAYDRDADLTDALVFDQYLDSGATTELYFVVWLSETGTDQTPGKGTNSGPNTEKPEEGFFGGNVVFNSGAGGEVSATFSGYTRVARTD